MHTASCHPLSSLASEASNSCPWQQTWSHDTLNWNTPAISFHLVSETYSILYSNRSVFKILCMSPISSETYRKEEK